ncbi:hypothetical protein GCK32_007969, partial [Trichostrongylus colubriformis]
VTIRQLRDTIKQLEEEKTREVEKAIDVIEKELLEAIWDEFAVRDHETTMRSDKLKAENAALEKKVSELEALMRDAQRRLDVARVAADRKEALENEHIDILSRDLNDANRRVIARLTEENQRLVEKAALEAKKARGRCDELTMELEKRAHQIKQLEVLLADQSDYEAIKKELRLLREIEFGEAATANEESIARLGETVQSLDKLLAAKNRRLQNDNALLRQANERYQGDEIMQAILAGSHQVVVEAVTTRVGREVAEGYAGDADQIRRRSKPEIHAQESERAKSNADDDQNLFKILMVRVAANVRALGSRALNTAEIARQCKRLMVAYNIGQRLFAKYVMNQSQGSLSELLSKPRHWSKLTDKGREAFRRIYGWISDAEAVDLLCSLSPRRVWPSESILTKRLKENFQYRLAGTNQAANAGSTTRNSRWRHDDIPKEKIMSIFQTELAKLREQESTLERAIATRSFGNGHRRSEDTSPSYHEMSHNDRMASINHAHQVSWSDLLLFGEAVLGISAGGCSELFLRPRRWSTLSVRGREPFEKMRAWLADKEAVQRLLVRERRTIITEQQKEALRFVFQHEHHPSQKTVELLSLKLNLNIRTVNNWFHNHRTRQKASMKEGKVYPPAVGSLPTSKNWQQDLHAILENASRYALLDEAPPTMVPPPATILCTAAEEPSAKSSSATTNSSSPLFSSSEER